MSQGKWFCLSDKDCSISQIMHQPYRDFFSGILETTSPSKDTTLLIILYVVFMLFFKWCVFYILGLVLYKIIIPCSTKCAWKFSLSLSHKDYFCPPRMDKLSLENVLKVTYIQPSGKKMLFYIIYFKYQYILTFCFFFFSRARIFPF